MANNKRKPVQVSVGGEGGSQVYVLCDDDTLWYRCPVRDSNGNVTGYKWIEVKLDIPQPA